MPVRGGAGVLSLLLLGSSGVACASAQQQDDGSACTLGWAERNAKETSIAHGLNRQLLAQLTANGFTFTELEKAGEKRGVHCKGSCFPYLQTKAAEQLLNATVNAGAWIKLNSALRTSAQQYLLWRWAALGRNKISKASRPGGSGRPAIAL